jgi:hypothetical protein
MVTKEWPRDGLNSGVDTAIEMENAIRTLAHKTRMEMEQERLERGAIEEALRRIPLSNQNAQSAFGNRDLLGKSDITQAAQINIEEPELTRESMDKACCTLGVGFDSRIREMPHPDDHIINFLCRQKYNAEKDIEVIERLIKRRIEEGIERDGA